MNLIQTAFRKLRKFKLSWDAPAKTDVVVFDRYATQGILPLLAGIRFSVFENQGHKLNVPTILRMLAKLHFSWIDYCATYIALCDAQVVVTGIDSNPLFYRLKHRLPGVKFVAVQNGIRGTGSPVRGGDLWTALRTETSITPSVDVIATFGPAHSEQYKRHISCSTIEIGSARNNQIPIHVRDNSSTRNRIGLISNFDGLPHDDIFLEEQASRAIMYLENRPVSAKDYFAADAQTATMLAEICQQNDWDLCIIGRRTSSFPAERRFFERACGALPFRFISKYSEESSYKELDQMNLVVSVDSTLGYEMIARGQRVLFLPLRAKLLGGVEAEQFRFGFPYSFPDEGPFWLSTLETGRVSSRITQLLSLSNEQWTSMSLFVLENLMGNDPGNTKLANVISEVLDQSSINSD